MHRTQRILRRARGLVSYANVVATLALFLALGGGIAWAALGKNSVKSRQIAPKAVKTSDIATNAVTGAKIKDDAVTGAKVKDDAVTGADVVESSLGKVPAATNADSVGGNTIARVSLINATTGNVAAQTILDLNGLILRGSCTTGLEQVVADTTVAGGEISSIGLDAVGGGVSQATQDDDFNPGDNVALVNPTTPNNDVYNVNYQGGDGRTVTVQFSTEGPNAGTCEIGGHAIG